MRLASGTDPALLAGLAISLWAFVVPPGFAPPYLDYDTATIGIFTNNLTYHHQFDFGFRDSLDSQERYRGFWAAQFLAVATVLSALQAGLGVAPEDVGELLHAVTLALGAAAGWIALLRRRDEASVVFALALGGILAVMLGPGFPEGRYLLPIVPCYAWGAAAALRSVVPRAAARAGVQAAALAAMGLASFAAVHGPYQQAMLDAGRPLAGLREAVSLIRARCGRDCAPDRPLFLAHPVAGFQQKLYVDMLTNMQYRAVDPDDSARLAAVDAPVFAVADADDPNATAVWGRRGFVPLGEVMDTPSSTRFLVLEKR